MMCLCCTVQIVLQVLQSVLRHLFLWFPVNGVYISVHSALFFCGLVLAEISNKTKCKVNHFSYQQKLYQLCQSQKTHNSRIITDYYKLFFQPSVDNLIQRECCRFFTLHLDLKQLQTHEPVQACFIPPSLLSVFLSLLPPSFSPLWWGADLSQWTGKIKVYLQSK